MATVPATVYGTLLVWLGGVGLDLEIHAPFAASVGCAVVGSTLLAWVASRAHVR